MWNELYTWTEDKGIDVFPISLTILVIYLIYSYAKIKNKRKTQSQVLCKSCKYKKLDSLDDINLCHEYKKLDSLDDISLCHEYKKSSIFNLLSFQYPSYCPIDMNKIEKIDKVNMKSRNH